MKAKPILFNTDMVRAIVEGRKTQTRRMCKGLPQDDTVSPVMIGYEPPFLADDILWVRETWNYGYVESSDEEGSHESWFEELRKPAIGYLGALSRYFYLADKADEQIMDEIGGKWRPSIHMPKDAARIFLRVKNVRCERLKQILASPQDFSAEGVKTKTAPSMLWEFKDIWNSTIPNAYLLHFGWDANPWVWVIDFERLDGKPAGLWADRETTQRADQGVLTPAT